MRHAARTPPTPDFIACGLLRLASLRRLTNVMQSFEVNVCYYQFFASFPPVLCRYFALIFLRLHSLSVLRLHSLSVLRLAFGTHCHCQCSASSLHCVSCLAATCSHVMQETVPELFPKPVKLRPSG